MLFNFLDSHDVGRVYSRCGNVDTFIQQLVVLMTMPGTPCIYYGTEIAMEGICGPYNRKPMPWKEIESGKYDEIMKCVQELIRTRHQFKALKGNKIQWNQTEGRLLNYIRPGELPIEMYINNDEHSVPLNLQEQEIVFAHKYEENTLLSGGALIIRRDL